MRWAKYSLGGEICWIEFAGDILCDDLKVVQNGL